MPEGSFRKEKTTKKNRESARARKKRRQEERRPISWIWLVDGSAADADRNPAMNEALRIEWAKTRALGLRNTEEVDLLEEEMRQVPEFLRWRAHEWESKKIHSAETRLDFALNFELKWVGVAELIAAGRAEVAAAEAEAVAEAAAESSGDEGSGDEGDAGDEDDNSGDEEDGDSDVENTDADEQ
ncbi:hypothetical protein B0H16DRAFT_1723726 [Mycena metata]|uniref:Uncharacterized protein n=1 Tax=Mycena metata TaxID=1033252 RepID=A0AAD7IZ65_9AGAR|nr:hypothetical protein B0H16DRAFT_1723726 [Mycena metata]